MPQFAPNETKTAIAPIVAKPSGMNCEAELFLGPDPNTRAATSGRVPFVSTGAAKNVSLPITMPLAPGTYHGYIDVFAGDLRFLAYILKEDVVIAAPAFTYQVLACYLMAVPDATAWRTPQMTVRIGNPSSQQVTRVVTYRNGYVSGTAYNLSESWSVTIPAGGYVDWTYTYWERVEVYPGGWVTRSKTFVGGDGVIDVWLEDDAGGKSTVYRLPAQAFGA